MVRSVVCSVCVLRCELSVHSVNIWHISLLCRLLSLSHACVNHLLSSLMIHPVSKKEFNHYPAIQTKKTMPPLFQALQLATTNWQCHFVHTNLLDKVGTATTWLPGLTDNMKYACYRHSASLSLHIHQWKSTIQATCTLAKCCHKLFTSLELLYTKYSPRTNITPRNSPRSPSFKHLPSQTGILSWLFIIR